MTNLNTLDLTDLARIIQPLIDEIPGPLYSVDVAAHGSVSVHTEANVSDFTEDLVWRTNISPTWVTSLSISGIDVRVFAKGEPYRMEDPS